MAEINNPVHEFLETSNPGLAAIEASRDAIWISNADQEVIFVNSALERMTGKTRTELLGQSCKYLFDVHTLDGTAICDSNCPFLATRGDTDQDLGAPIEGGGIEGTMPVAGGKEAFIEISYGLLRDPVEQDLSGVVHIIHDLTQRREVEKLKDEFISMVSHELRTPLHHIKGFTTTLLQTDVAWDAETQRDFLESINREADRLNNLVEKILHLSRLETGGLPMDKDWVAINELLDGAFVRRKALTDPQRLLVNQETNLPPLFVDAREIETVLINLVENAQKYSAVEQSTVPPVVVSVHRRENEAIFSVCDQGPGIPLTDRPHIFERFFRGYTPPAAKAGSGLGLAICKRIVEGHGGRIWLDSGEAGNTRFCFALPIGGEEANEENAPSGGG